MPTDERPHRIIPSDRDRELALEALISIAMAEAGKIEVDARDVAEYYQGLLVESDRAAGILAFAFIESQISELFAQHLDPDISGGVASVIGQNGILDSVGARLRML